MRTSWSRYGNMNLGGNRNFLLGVVFAVLWIGLNASVSCIADTIPQLVAKTKPATVQILALDENWSPIKSGTGFFISSDGLIVTNYHVIQGAAHFKTPGRQSGTLYSVRRDALLTVGKPSRLAFPALKRPAG
jgi:S1-C subfamily serine protease